MIEAERHHLEFTSGQLIIAICGLLFLWLVGFLMGVMAGRIEFGSSVAELDSPVNPPAEAAAPEPKAPAPETPKAAAPPKKDERVRTARTETPAPKPTPPAKKAPVEPPKPPATEKTAAKPSEPEKPATAPKVVTDRPSHAATQTQAEAAAARKPQETPAEPPKEEKPADAPKDKPVDVAKVETDAPKAPDAGKPADELAREELAPKPKEEAAPAKAPAKAPSGKHFTVQVFSAKKSNKAYAEDYVKNLKETAGMEGRIVETEKTYQVVIGQFEDRAAAEKLRDELKKKAGFADCMVREIKP